MSIKQMAKVWELDLDHAQRLVLLALADHAHDDGSNSRPSLGYVGWKTGYALSSVKRIVGTLRAAGLLRVAKEGGGRYATIYQLCLDKGKVKEAYQGQGEFLDRVHFETGITRDTAAVSPVSPQPLVKPSLSTSTKDKGFYVGKRKTKGELLRISQEERLSSLPDDPAIREVVASLAAGMKLR